MCRKFVMVQDYIPPEKIVDRAYTPQFTFQLSAAVRRFAWALNLPMTTTMKSLIMALPALIDKTFICSSCKDKSDCCNCIFNSQPTAEEQAQLLSALNFQQGIKNGC